MGGIGGIFRKGIQSIQKTKRNVSPTKRGFQSARGETSEPTQPPIGRARSAPESRGNEPEINFGETLTSLKKNIATVPHNDTAKKLGKLFHNLFKNFINEERNVNSIIDVINGIFSEEEHQRRRLLSAFSQNAIDRSQNPLETYLQDDYQENALLKKDDIEILSKMLNQLPPNAVEIFKKESGIGEHFDDFKKTAEDIKNYILEKEIKKEYNERQLEGSCNVLIQSLKKLNTLEREKKLPLKEKTLKYSTIPQAQTDIGYNYATVICAIKDTYPKEKYQEILRDANEKIGLDNVSKILQNKTAKSVFESRLKSKYDNGMEIVEQITFDNFFKEGINKVKQNQIFSGYTTKGLFDNKEKMERRLLSVIHSSGILNEDYRLVLNGKTYKNIEGIYQKAKELSDEKKQNIKNIHNILQNLQGTGLKNFKDAYHLDDTKFEKIKEVFKKVFDVTSQNEITSHKIAQQHIKASSSGTDSPSDIPFKGKGNKIPKESSSSTNEAKKTQISENLAEIKDANQNKDFQKIGEGFKKLFDNLPEFKNIINNYSTLEDVLQGLRQSDFLKTLLPKDIQYGQHGHTVYEGKEYSNLHQCYMHHQGDALIKKEDIVALYDGILKPLVSHKNIAQRKILSEHAGLDENQDVNQFDDLKFFLQTLNKDLDSNTEASSSQAKPVPQATSQPPKRSLPPPPPKRPDPVAPDAITQLNTKLINIFNKDFNTSFKNLTLPSDVANKISPKVYYMTQRYDSYKRCEDPLSDPMIKEDYSEFEKKHYKQKKELEDSIRNNPKLLQVARDKINDVLKNAGIQEEILENTAPSEIERICMQVLENQWYKKPSTDFLYNILMGVATEEESQKLEEELQKLEEELQKSAEEFSKTKVEKWFDRIP